MENLHVTVSYQGKDKLSNFYCKFISLTANFCYAVLIFFLKYEELFNLRIKSLYGGINPGASFRDISHVTLKQTFDLLLFPVWSWNSSVSTVTGLQAAKQELGLNSQQGQDFSFLHSVQTAFEAQPASPNSCQGPFLLSKVPGE
jgi:hypothetical protein